MSSRRSTHDAGLHPPGRHRQEPSGTRGEAEHVPVPTPVSSSPPMGRRAGGDLVLRWQQLGGNRFAQRSVLALSGTAALRRQVDDPVRRSPRLGTALDSQVTTESNGAGAYTILLHLDDGGGERSVPIATYQAKASVTARQLPVSVEDVVTEGQARVRIKYVPQYGEVQVLLLGSPTLLGHRVRVRADPVAAEDLLLAKATTPTRVGGPNETGYVAEGSERVTTHLGSAPIDTVIASVASAEGGFASVEASDRGVFTWGQGQWTVTGGELQRVLAFIKARRPDLWDRYWGEAGLDLTAGAEPSFVFGGTTFATNVADMQRLFRPTRERNLMWTTVFAQAGMDPQIQRLQRAFMRAEVGQLLEGKGKYASLRVNQLGPNAWLDERGQAFYFSMWTNAPRYAHQWLTAAVQAHGGETPVNKRAIAAALEESFRTSGVKAWQDVGTVAQHHVIAFWGTAGRTEGVAHARAHADVLAAGEHDAAGWTRAQWEAQATRLEHRQSRHEKTAADVTAALARTNVEPDLPPDMELDLP